MINPNIIKAFRVVVDRFVSKRYHGDPKWLREDDREELAERIAEEHLKIINETSDPNALRLKDLKPLITGHVCADAIGLDELTPKQAKDRALVLSILAENKTFSTFDATANIHIANTMDRLGQDGFFKTVGGSWPWCNIEITEAGQKFLDENKPTTPAHDEPDHLARYAVNVE